MIAPIEIEAPDGSIVEFPEGTPPEAIKAAMAKRFPANKWKNNLRQPQEVARADTGEKLDPRDPNAMAIRQLAAAGGWDPSQPVGDRRHPRVAMDADADIEGLEPNSFYIKDGRVLQAPVRSENVSDTQFGDSDAAFYLNNKGAKQFQYTLNPSEKSRVDWISKNYPEAQWARDERGNLVVQPRNGDEWMYLNKPGIDILDAVEVGNQALLYSPAGAAAKPGASLALNSARVGAASGGVSMAQDVATGQPIDLGKATLATGGGALGEFVAPAAGALTKAATQVPGRVRSALAGRGSGEAVQSPLGSATGALSDDFAARAAQTPDQSGIPLTRGQQSGNFDDIAFEQAALRGARGNEAGEVMRGFAGNQAAAVRNAGRGLAGRETVQNLNEAGAVVQQGVRERAGAAKAQVGKAYDEIKASDATVSAPTIGELPGRIKAKLEEDFFSPEVMTSLNPRVSRIFAEIDNLAKSAPDAEAKMPIAGLERIRQAINSAKQGAQGNDAQALSIAKREFDDWLDDAIDNELIKGDPGTIEQLKKARGLYADYRRLYGGGRKDEGAQKIVDRLIDRGSNEVDAVNLLFGRAKLDGSGTAVQTLKNIKEIVGDGPELSAMKEGAVMRLMSRMSRNEGGGVGNINYKALADDWTDALDGSGAPLMRELFTREEIGSMREFVATLRRLTPPEGSVNRSGSGYEVARAVGNAASILGSKLKLMPLVRGAEDTLNVSRARAATSGKPRPGPLPRTPITGVLGGATGGILGGPRAGFVSPPPQ